MANSLKWKAPLPYIHQLIHQSLQADYGETVHEVLNKALGLQQALAWDDEDGNLLIGRVGTARATTALVWGENILSCDTEQSIRDRFSEYQLAGQRAARTEETTYTVQGWRQGNGRLWQPNQRVIVLDPVLGFQHRERVISEVVYTRNEGGTLCQLRVAPEAAYISPLREETSEEDDFF
ncbi:phage tail protein [Candidatus Hamiltonella defensa]|uniref:Phage tail protein n=1 Tax=Candidatus Williamhamiltonella defendens TaxID=138072 RepID=A0AAC9VL34_9ENTR|nr:hypothetical protein CJJ18_01885 [Candidatus Hamiltonella defensa]AWK16013.1 hypothetical protein CCS40_01865 [Candidatus Hamiltonella defensa]MBK4362308.1 phage tail protein [Candidatus Hamiltonella defensa]